MKGLKIISVILIIASIFGIVAGGMTVADVLNAKAMWEDTGTDLLRLEDGIAQLKANEEVYLAGKKQLDEGRAQLAEGQAQYDAGKEALAEGEKQLADGKQQLEDNKAMYESGKELVESISKLDESYAKWHSKYKKSPTDAGLKDGQTEIGDTIADIWFEIKSNETFTEQINLSEGVGSVIDFVIILLPELNYAMFDKAVEAIDTTLMQAADYIAPLLKEYEDGLAQYEEGLVQYEEGKAQLIDGEKQLADGKKQLADGEAQLKVYEDGIAQVKAGMETLLSTPTYSGIVSIRERLGEDFDYNNGELLNFEECERAVKTVYGFADDVAAKVKAELYTRAAAGIALIAASSLLLVAGIWFFSGKKLRAPLVIAVIAAIAELAAIIAYAVAGIEMSAAKGSSVGFIPYIGGAVTAACAGFGIISAISVIKNPPQPKFDNED